MVVAIDAERRMMMMIMMMIMIGRVGAY